MDAGWGRRGSLKKHSFHCCQTAGRCEGENSPVPGTGRLFSSVLVCLQYRYYQIAVAAREVAKQWLAARGVCDAPFRN